MRLFSWGGWGGTFRLLGTIPDLYSDLPVASIGVQTRDR